MAQYSTDFADSAYSTGSEPPDWTARWAAALSAAAAVFTVETDISGTSFGDQVLQVDYQVSDYSALSWDDVGSQADVDIKVRVRWRQANILSYGTGLVVRGDEDSNGEIGYVVAGYPYANKLLLWRIENGSYSEIGSAYIPRTLIVDQWYWLRLQISGTALKVRLWRDDEGEPAAWNIEETDSNISAAGWCGVFVRKDDGEVDWFGAGTGTDAPPAAPSAEGDARVTQDAIEVLRQATSQTQPVVVVIAG